MSPDAIVADEFGRRFIVTTLAVVAHALQSPVTQTAITELPESAKTDPPNQQSVGVSTSESPTDCPTTTAVSQTSRQSVFRFVLILLGIYAVFFVVCSPLPIASVLMKHKTLGDALYLYGVFWGFVFGLGFTGVAAGIAEPYIRTIRERDGILLFTLTLVECCCWCFIVLYGLEAYGHRTILFLSGRENDFLPVLSLLVAMFIVACIRIPIWSSDR